jgi:transcriptional regulator with XRE-family HTH domain
MGVADETISRWENGSQQIKKSNDLLLRLIYCNMKGIPTDEIARLIEEEFPSIEEAYKEIPPYVIAQTEWAKGEACSSF